MGEANRRQHPKIRALSLLLLQPCWGGAAKTRLQLNKQRSVFPLKLKIRMGGSSRLPRLLMQLKKPPPGICCVFLSSSQVSSKPKPRSFQDLGAPTDFSMLS